MGRDEVILIDTHVAIWIATETGSIGRQSKSLIESAAREERLLISAISFWEVALLVSKRRLSIGKTPSQLREQLLDGGVTELPVTGPIALLAVDLKELHGDPADRLIAATAVIQGATLMTADADLLRWRHSIQRQDASK
jgi:PIN domain nuclease of toxin-antitoxin system